MDVVRSKIGATTTDFEAGEVKMISTSLLVPGEIIIIPKSGCVMPCDAVLLNGLCIVNEAMLTGNNLLNSYSQPFLILITNF